MAKAKVNIVQGSIDVGKMKSVRKEIKNTLEEYETIKNDVNTATKTLLGSWRGKGASEFKSQYRIAIRKIEDIEDSLTDLYKALQKAEKSYEKADEKLKVKISKSK